MILQWHLFKLSNKLVFVEGFSAGIFLTGETKTMTPEIPDANPLVLVIVCLHELIHPFLFLRLSGTADVFFMKSVTCKLPRPQGREVLIKELYTKDHCPLIPFLYPGLIS